MPAPQHDAYVIVPVLAISMRRVYRTLWIALSALLACDWFCQRRIGAAVRECTRLLEHHGAPVPLYFVSFST